MPRPWRAYGRPNTAVIPTDWAASHRAIVEDPASGILTLTIAWRAPADLEAPFDPDTLSKTTNLPDPYYTGPADAQLLPQLMQDKVVGDQDDQVTTVGYRLTLPVEAGADRGFRLDDVGTVTAVTGNADATMLGRTLVVRGIERPSHGWSQYLLVTERIAKG